MTRDGGGFIVIDQLSTRKLGSCSRTLEHIPPFTLELVEKIFNVCPYHRKHLAIKDTRCFMAHIQRFRRYVDRPMPMTGRY